MVWRMIASVAGIGRAPFAPGTVASAVAAITGVALLRFGVWGPLLGAVIATGLGVVALRRLGPAIANTDPGWVVIDEVAGQWLAIAGIAAWSRPWWGAAVAFAGFRVLDILKPGPIGWLDARHGPVAIMADDVAAGFCVMVPLTVMGMS